MNRNFVVFYCFILLVHLIAGSFDYDLIAFYSKPLLLIALLVYFGVSTRRLSTGLFRKLIVAALFFSLVGDILLLFQNEGSSYFLGGLSSFFLAHLAYLWAFTRVNRQNQEVELIKRQGWIMILILAYGFLFFRQLKDHLGTMSGPVIAYIVVISLMMLMAVNRYHRVSDRSFWLITIGALLFVISDSVLAWNKFVHPVAAAHILIMGTYGLAQLLIAGGAIAQVKDSVSTARE